jgi:tetratricopeptide (TPR) repeat protein
MAIIESLDDNYPLPHPSPPPSEPALSPPPDDTNTESPSAESSTTDLLANVTSQKLLGNTLFTEKRYEEAIQQYNKSLSICPPLHAECAILHANIAACHAKLEQWQECYDSASEALTLTPIYEKAQSRRALAGEKIATSTSLQTALDGIPLVKADEITWN